MTIIPIGREGDIVAARQKGRELAGSIGFSQTEQTLIATAISEIARNIIEHAGTGEVELGVIYDRGRSGILIVARDQGPGITDLEAAMRDGFSTRGSLGLGLPGARRLVDQLDVTSRPGHGTTVTMRKWVQ
ncbi:MAG TPA: anti-sigma regulatory factor [Polyangiaceae bacterium]|nr:anti-sigma regulatory factor [Polyangiaceae bacterium]